MKKKNITKKEAYFKCKKCGDEIYWNTHKKMIYCRCESIAIDGCEYYVRIVGNKESYKRIEK